MSHSVQLTWCGILPVFLTILLKIFCSTAYFFEKGCPKIHSPFKLWKRYESIMDSERHTDIFWFAFYSFQIIPMCFFDCCYTLSWCPQTAICSGSKILFLIVYLFHPTSWALANFKFQLNFSFTLLSFSRLFCNCLSPEQFAVVWKLCKLTWNDVIYDIKITAWYRSQLRSLWHSTGKISPLWKLTIQSLSSFLTNWYPERNPTLFFLDSFNVLKNCW